MDSATEMRVFARAIDRGSFSAAGADLDLTPSAVSKLVTRIEDRLGVRLLFRTTRRLTLTPEGEIYLARARQILADIADAEEEVTRGRGRPRGTLRVSVGTAFAAHQLAPALPEFLAQYPEIQVELVVTDRVVDIAEEQADVAIRTGPVADTSLIVRKFADAERMVCASPGYLARVGAPQEVEDILRHDVLLVSTVPGLSQWGFRMPDGSRRVIDVSPKVSSDDAETIFRLCVAGAGIARLLDMIFGEAVRDGRLIELLPDRHLSEPVPVQAVYPPGRHRLPKLTVFLDFLSKRFGTSPWKRWRSEAAARRAGDYADF
jgi:DNA-binding transcriptional LysR family regulator